MAMAERKPFLLRIDSDLYTALARWADDELRSLNGQIEFLLNRILAEAGRLPTSLGRQPEHASGVRRREPGSSRALAPRSAARKPSSTRTQVRQSTSPGRQPEHASGVRRREPASSQTPALQPAARKPVDETPPARRLDDDWDAMVD
jgi:hypothetical protein